MKIHSQSTSSLSVYLDRKVLIIFLFGLISGLPWVMIGSSLTIWLKDSGFSRPEIGYAGLIFAVYSINFVWSPLVNDLRFKLFKRIGHRRSWIFCCQAIIVLSCLILSTISIEQNASLAMLIALTIALSSATQDIAIDAYRIDMFTPAQTTHITAAASMTTAGWWTGYAGIGALPLILSDMGWNWPKLYLLLGLITMACALLLLLAPDPETRQKSNAFERFSNNLQMLSQSSPKIIQRVFVILFVFVLFLFAGIALIACGLKGGSSACEYLGANASYPFLVLAGILTSLIFLIIELNKNDVTQVAPLPPMAKPASIYAIPAWIVTTIVDPLKDFFDRNGIQFALTLLSFIFLFKLGEAFLGRMSIVFYKEIGFSNTDIAKYSKLLTWALTIIAAIPCGLLNVKFGIVKGLWISGICMALSNLMFTAIALVGPDINLYIATIIVDGLTGAWSTIAFVSFISMLCSRTFSAVQYALLASLGSFGRSTLAATSGQIVDLLQGNWAIFFIGTTLMVIPGLVILAIIGKRLKKLSPDEKDRDSQASS